MNGSLPADLVVARDDELDSARRFLRGVGQGPGALLLEGEPGVGKTTIWEAALAEPDDSLQVLSARPAEAEMELSFAALGDLLGGLAQDVREELPEPQRRALDVALLFEPGGGRPPERRAVALGLLGALRALARRDRLLIAIDDVQWLDPPTATALTFALRRLRDEPIRLLLTQRLEPDVPVALSLDRPPPDLVVERVEVGPLSLAALQRLLRERTGALFTRPTLRRIHETSGGNPFFALELARALGDRSPDPGEPLPVPDGLRGLLRRRLRGLPESTTDLLLAAALLGQPTVVQLEAVAGNSAADLEAAIDAKLLRVEARRVRYTHPLLASAVVEAAGQDRLRTSHRRLAEVVEEPEKRVRHLALAADGPDEQIAEALERTAAVVIGRGAPGAAAELSLQARRLTPAGLDKERACRTLDAGTYAWLAGDGARALRLLREAASTAPEGRERARALRRLAQMEAMAGDRPAVPGLCATALAQVGDDLRLRGELHAQLAWCLLMMRKDTPEAARNARVAVELADRLGDDALLIDALPAQAQCELLMGTGLPEAQMQRALALRDPAEIRSMQLPQMHAGLLQLCADRLDEARSSYQEVLDFALVRGDESGVPFPLMRLAHVELLAGNWRLASDHAAAGHEQAVQSEQPTLEAMLLCTRALVAAHLGSIQEARESAERGRSMGAPFGDGIGARIALWAAGLVELSVGNAAEAQPPLEELYQANQSEGIIEPGENRYLGDLIEALIELGRLDEASDRIEELERHASRLRRPAARAVAGRCRGLAAAARGEPEQALAELEAALSLHDEVPLPFERARTLLALGPQQRRARRQRDARASLSEARTVFADLGAALWQQRAEAELEHIGGRSPSSGALTPSERRVAELVATGLSNREVAAALVVTERTVESHLSHVYRKLSLRSRAELAHRYSTVAEGTKVP